MSKLKPWAAGPFELIRHAEGHLKAGSDFDKRMALVSFDNAVEVSINTYLQLHPTQRGGKNYERKKVEEWLVNYHKKLEFLQHFTAEQKVPIEVSLDEIVFYHNLRNELYHSGNGMVPELQCLAGARAGAIWIFSLLFDSDAELLLKQAAEVIAPMPDTTERPYSAHTELLQSFISFERTLRSSLTSMGAIKQPPARLPASEAWVMFAEHVDELNPEFLKAVEDSIPLRNTLIHGETTELSGEQIYRLIRKLDRVTEFVNCFPASRDFLAELKARVGDSISENLSSIRIVQELKRVFLDVATVTKGAVIEKRINRTDLNFLGDYPHERSLFLANKPADENADLFLREFADREFCEYFPEMFRT